jgi:hypothetical protein
MLPPHNLFTTKVITEQFQLKATLNVYEPSTLRFSDYRNCEVHIVNLSHDQATTLIHLHGRLLGTAYAMLRTARPDFRPPKLTVAARLFSP